MVKRYVQDIRREFKGYNGSTLKNDLLAGLTVTAVALPLALAFGIGSGATAQSGLITAIIAGSIIAIFAGASSQISGPTGAMMAILILMVQDYGINSIFVAGVMSGIVLILCGVLRLGKVVTFIPAPVVIGFTSGIALVIAIGQIDNFLGAKTPGAESTALKFVGYFTHPFTPNPYAIGVALAVMLIMILWPKKWQAILPSSLVALIVVSAVSILANFPVDTIGEIPKSLLPKDRLDIFGIDFSLIKKMLVPCLSIAALNMMETLMCGEIGAKEKHEKYDPNRDLVSQGIGNIILPFFGGVPATAAIARSSVGIKSGGKTRLVSIFHAIGLLICMFLLGDVIKLVPMSALAGILMMTAWRMNEWTRIKIYFRRGFKSGISKYLITMFATIILDLTQAIIIGVLFAMVLFIARVSDMDINVAEVDVERLSDETGLIVKGKTAHIRVAYLTGPVYFATVAKLREYLFDFQKNGVLILSMRGVSLIDVSGLQFLDELYLELQLQGSRLLFSGLQPNVERMLQRSRVRDRLGDDSIYWSAEDAIKAASTMNR